MSTDLLDETSAINSIYTATTLLPLTPSSPQLYSLVLPSIPSISLRLEFPPNYPDAPPSILGTQSVGPEIPKGTGSHIVSILQDILAEIYVPGAACIFDLIEESSQRLSQLGLDAGSEEQTAQDASESTNGQDPPYENQEDIGAADPNQINDLGETPPWSLSEVITEKKSIFLARSAPVTSPDQAKSYLHHLLATDKKVAKATHNITAWRIRGEGAVQFQDCDDDGETAAGGRLLHLLELMGVWNVMVVVTRWYGGVQLGPDRFRLINACGREAVLRGGFGVENGEGKEGGKKKGKK